MDVRIVTVTSRPAHRWLCDSVQSVAASLPVGAQHLVVRSSGDPLAWNAHLWAACHGADLVAIVDDDDVVLPGAIASCMSAIKSTGAALAFTDEEEIDEEGRQLRVGMARSRTLMDLAMHPRCVHHLAMFRPRMVPRSALDTANSCGRGLDWLMRAAAGLRGGAVRVPMVGYQWRRHSLQDSSVGADEYATAMPALRKLTRSWMAYDATIQEVPPCGS